MREGPICLCPECKKGDIFEIDTGLYTCTSCHKTWTLEEFYPLLWLEQLMKLVKRRQRQKRRESRVLSVEDIEKEIAFTSKRIEKLKLLIIKLEDALNAADYALDSDHIEDLERALEIKQYRLKSTRKDLEELCQKRDELTNRNNNSTQ